LPHRAHLQRALRNPKTCTTADAGVDGGAKQMNVSGSSLQRQGLDILVKAFFPLHLHRANLMTVEELEATAANQPMTAEQAAIILLQ
jgi:hypothetical protein